MPERALRESVLTKGLGAEEIEAVAKKSRVAETSPGQVLFARGQQADTTYLVELGEIALTLPMTIRDTAAEITVDEAGPGALVGWSGLVSPFRRTLGAKSVSESRLIALDREALMPLFADQPHIHLIITTNLAEVIGSRVTHLEALLLGDLQRWVGGASS